MTDQTDKMNNGTSPNEPEDPSSETNSIFQKLLNKVKDTFFTDDPQGDLRDQLEQAVSLNDDSNNSFTEQERMMISNILRYGALRVEDVMVPRVDIHAIDENLSLEELLLTFQNVGHSRLPLYQDTLDAPTGMVHVKDLLSWIADQHLNEKNQTPEAVQLKVIAGGKGQAPELTRDPIPEPSPELAPEHASEPDQSEELVSNQKNYRTLVSDFSIKIKDADLKREVIFVPPSMPVVNLLLRMQSTRIHLALVVDEYGGTDGLVSIEDLVEEVVGEIEDEHDEDNGGLLTGDSETGLIASARLSIEELEAELNVDLFVGQERDDDIDTLGGLVFSLCGRVPVRGEVIIHPSGLEIEVLNADPRRIKTLKIVKK